MTPARARALQPDLETGLAVTTSLDLGRCPIDAPPPVRCEGELPPCGTVRRPLRVWVEPLEGSLRLDPGCPSGLGVRELEARSGAGVESSPTGELVLSLAPGRYLVAAARDGSACAGCGAVLADRGCAVDVRAGRVAVREIVL